MSGGETLLWGVTALIALDVLALTYVSWSRSQSPRVVKAVLSVHFALVGGYFLGDGISDTKLPGILFGVSSILGSVLLWMWPGVSIELRKQNCWRAMLVTVVSVPVLLLAGFVMVELFGNATEALFTAIGAIAVVGVLVGLAQGLRERWRLAHH